MATDILYGQEIREKICAGVRTVANAARTVMGPKGRDALLWESGRPLSVRDGAAVTRLIELEDPYENLGAQVIKRAALATEEMAGDGTAVSAVLAGAILEEGVKNIAAGANPIELKKGIQGAVQLSCAAIQKLTRPVESSEDIRKVSQVSAKSDFAGELVAQALERVGPDGILSVEESLNAETVLEITEGMQYEKGYFHVQLLKEPESRREELENPYILVTDEEISNAQELLPLLEQLQAEGRSLLIIAENITGSALSLLLMNKRQGIVNVSAAHPPAYGDGRIARMEDICVFTGGTFITKHRGCLLRDTRLELLGTAEKVVMTPNRTAILSGHGDPSAIQTHISGLQQLMMAEDYGFKKERMRERIAKFTKGTAVIKVGAHTELEMKEKKYRLENAVQAAKAAAAEGIVPGGGTVYLDILPAVCAYRNTLNGDRKTGVSIVLRALEEPARRIAENAGQDPSVVVHTIRHLERGFGYDVDQDAYVDMRKAGILDPSKTARLALQCAASAAAAFLSAEAGVVVKKEGNDREGKQDAEH